MIKMLLCFGFVNLHNRESVATFLCDKVYVLISEYND